MNDAADFVHEGSDTYVAFKGGDPTDKSLFKYCFKGEFVDEETFTRLINEQSAGL